MTTDADAHDLLPAGARQAVESTFAGFDSVCSFQSYNNGYLNLHFFCCINNTLCNSIASNNTFSTCGDTLEARSLVS